MKIVGREEAREHLWQHYATTVTAEEAPLAVVPLPYERWIPGDGDAWYFAIRHEGGAVAIKRVGPRGSVSTVVSFTAGQWSDVRDAL